MRLVVLTYGTEGDARPLAALSHTLRTAGHEVCLLGDARTLGTAQALGIPAMPLSGDIRQLFAEWGKQGPRGTARALVELTNANAATWMREALAAARGCDAIVASGLVGFAGASVAEHLKLPVIWASMIPLTPSREFPAPFLPPRWIPRWLNKASLAFTNKLLWSAFKKALNRARADVLGLPSIDSPPADPPMLYGISPTLLPRPADWPVSATLCGQWTIPTANDFEPPAELARFLADGPAPIYVGFGSMTGIDMPKMLSVVIEALDGRRALFWPGWNGMAGASLPDNIKCIDATPHDWLFPRMAAVIHHGGSGTTHSALRAGKPSIVMPFAGDQAFWADRLRRLGVAPPALSTTHPDAKALASALAFVGREPVAARARELGLRMAHENGVATAVAAIERLLAN